MYIHPQICDLCRDWRLNNADCDKCGEEDNDEKKSSSLNTPKPFDPFLNGLGL